MSRANGDIDGSDAVAILNCSTERTALEITAQIRIKFYE